MCVCVKFGPFDAQCFEFTVAIRLTNDWANKMRAQSAIITGQIFALAFGHYIMCIIIGRTQRIYTISTLNHQILFVCKIKTDFNLQTNNTQPHLFCTKKTKHIQINFVELYIRE